MLGIVLIDDGDDYLYIYIYIKFFKLYNYVVLLILDADKKRHDEALESHSKYSRNEKEREDEKKKNLYYTSVQFFQTLTCLSILSDMLSSDEVFLAFNHC